MAGAESIKDGSVASANGTEFLQNYIAFDRTEETLTGNIAASLGNIDVIGKGLASDLGTGQIFRIYGTASNGRLIEIGGIWEKKSGDGRFCYTLNIKTDETEINAELVRYPGQDNEMLMAVLI